MATADFEARQLLKAYRKGLISDELFEAEMRDLRNGGAGKYKALGKTFDNEKEMIVALLDEYRCAENFASEYLGAWNDASNEACVKGGLRVIQRREAYHAQLLEDRLRELGGNPQCTPSAAQRNKEMSVYAAKDKTDAEKLQYVADQITDLPKALSFITDVIDQIQDDQQTKELLRSLVQDEMSSAQWLLDAHKTMGGSAKAAA